MSERLTTVIFKGHPYVVSERWVKRRRVAKAAFVYATMTLLLAAVVLPFLYAMVSSFKSNPLEWPPSLNIPRLWPSNWVAAWRLGIQGGGNGWTGGWAPGREIRFSVVFLYPAGLEELPRVVVLAPPGRGSERPPDPRESTQAQILKVRETELPEGRKVEFEVQLKHVGDSFYPVLPLAVAGPRGTQFLQADLAPDNVRSLGTTAQWDNLVAGVIGYVFRYFIQAWTEFRDRAGNYLFPRWIWNSFFIAAIKVCVVAFFAAVTGYALARLYFPGKNVLFFLVAFTMMVPSQVTFISNYVLLRDGIFGISRLFGRENLLNTYWAMFLPGLVSSFGAMMIKQYLESIPKGLDEAARIDGANIFQIFVHIILPLSKPALAALCILTFQGSWNEFFWPLVVLRDVEMFTLPVGLLFFRQYYGAAGGAHWNLILAGTIISAIPVLIIFLIFQRYFVQGFHLSGIKQ